jgi:hypothetical protein
MTFRRYALAPALLFSLAMGTALAPARAFAAVPSAGVLLRGAVLGPTVSRTLLGVNMAVWTDITERGLAPPLATAGIAAVRWPGGSDSDLYHWRTNSLCAGGYADSRSTFDNFMRDVALPAKLDVSVTLDYGSDATCSGGGDPAEAAAWVAYAKARGYAVRYWTVGNEEYGSWEEDLHAKPHDPATYAAAVATGYYPMVKKADPNALVGVVVEGSPGWDGIVLKNAKYDFVELHYYAQAPGQESDAGLLANGSPNLVALVAGLRAELRAAGRPSVPIYLGELGSVYANPGKQAQSIVQALFAGMTLAELARNDVFRATWWIGYGGCGDASSGNFSSALYGWQDFGGYMIFSDGTPEYGCPNATRVPLGTLLPTARAYQVMSGFIHDGERVAALALSGSYGNLRAFGVSRGTSYALALFNLDKTAALATSIRIDTLAAGSSVQRTTYGKTQYDLSRNNVWAGPVTATSGAWRGPVSVTLPPWSMTVVTLNR